MKTQVIPAQITTVEDKIAGNLSLTQILLLLVPVLWTTFVFTFLAPRIHVSLYKIPLVLAVLFACVILSLRIKGKVVLSWAITLIRYNLRPKYYVFNKNDSFLRQLDLPEFERKQRVKVKKAVVAEKTQRKSETPILDLARLESFLANPKYSFSFRLTKKGGFDVAFWKEQK